MRGTVVGGGRNGRGVFLAEATGGATDLFPNLEKGRRRRGESDKKLWLPHFFEKGKSITFGGRFSFRFPSAASAKHLVFDRIELCCGRERCPKI